MHLAGYLCWFYRQAASSVFGDKRELNAPGRAVFSEGASTAVAAGVATAVGEAVAAVTEAASRVAAVAGVAVGVAVDSLSDKC